jgi:4-hydroxy-tetrahydrodipicolinate synthase
MAVFTGSGVAIVTPFHEEEKTIDYDRFEKLIEFQLENNTDAIIVTGTTGEASTLDDEEHLDAIRFVIKTVNGRVPVIAGVGSNDTRHGLSLSIEAEKAGADALLHVTPYYNKTSQRGLIEHFLTFANAVDIPIILYSVPSRTNIHIAPATLVELAEHKNIVGLKDATGDLSYTTEVRRLLGDRFDLWSGNDDVILPLLALGGKGVISVAANILPQEFHDLCARFFGGDVAGSRDIQVKYKELIDALFIEPNPIPVKTALKYMGLDSGALRLPLTTPSEATEAKLRQAMQNAGLI